MADSKIAYRTVNVDGVDIFYREAGPKDAPTVLLFHGFPSSSHMFRGLIPLLMDKYHIVAPDFPGYGQSSAPPVDRFEYTFEKFADVMDHFTAKIGLKSYALYLSDIGSSVGYHLAVKHPERVTALVIQNAAAYLEALNKEFIKPTVSQGEFSCGLVLKSSGRNTDNGDGCSTSVLKLVNPSCRLNGGLTREKAIF